MSFKKSHKPNEILTEKIDVSIINSLRRVLISNIPVVGFVGEGEDISISITRNETIHSNEMLAHRICMIPLHLSMEESEAYEDHSLTMKLDVYNKSTGNMKVTTKDMQFFMNGSLLSDKRRDEIIRPFIHNNTKYYHLIAHLKPSKGIALSGSAVTNTGSFHSSFSPVSGMRHYFDFDSSDTTRDPVQREMNFYREKGGSSNNTPKRIILGFDIINGYTQKEIIRKAFDVMMSMVDGMTGADKLESVKQAHENSFVFKFKDENHTMGNLLQTYVHNTYVLDKKNTAFRGKRCLYIGYKCPDPMVNVLEMKVTLENIDDELSFREFFRKICDEVIDELQMLKGKWEASMK